jgi:hypothetical protein
MPFYSTPDFSMLSNDWDRVILFLMLPVVFWVVIPDE